LNQAARQAAISQAAETFQKNFDQQRALQQIANIYDKHFTDDEIKGLLDFFSSPLGQKFAAESTKNCLKRFRPFNKRPPLAPRTILWKRCNWKMPKTKRSLLAISRRQQFRTRCGLSSNAPDFRSVHRHSAI